MNTWFGPQITYRGQVTEASPSRFTTRLSLTRLSPTPWCCSIPSRTGIEAISGGEKSTSLTYETAILDYGSPHRTAPAGISSAAAGGNTTPADLDQSLAPRDLRNAKVELLFSGRWMNAVITAGRAAFAKT